MQKNASRLLFWTIRAPKVDNLKIMKLWLYLMCRAGRSALIFTLGGTLIFIVAGLAEGALAGGAVAFILLPGDKALAATVMNHAIVIGAGTGLVSGLMAFGIAGCIQAVQAELRPYQFRYMPRDAPFWNCVRSALWASAMLGLGGALTGAVCGGGWAILHADASTGAFTALRFTYEIVCLLIGSAVGATVGFFAGVLTGALAPHSVQMARQRIKTGRQALLNCWQAARTAWLR